MEASLEHGFGEEQARLQVRGALTLDHAKALYEALSELGSRRGLKRVGVDLSGVRMLDTAGAVAVSVGARKLREADVACELVGIRPEHRQTFELIPKDPLRLPPPRPAVSWQVRLRRRLRAGVDALVELAELAIDTTMHSARCALARKRSELGTILEQMTVAGVDALLLVAPLSFFVGLVLAAESAIQLRKLGAEVFMAEILGLGVVREFAPMMTAIVVAGRSGASMAAEIATMTVQNETAALKTMGISTVRLLVVPRVVALTLAQPALTLISMCMGLLGGLMASYVLQLPVSAVFFRMRDVVGMDAFALGLFKSFIFAWTIGLSACFMGPRIGGGPHGVGHATTRAVVASIFFIVVLDSVIGLLWAGGGRV